MLCKDCQEAMIYLGLEIETFDPMDITCFYECPCCLALAVDSAVDGIHWNSYPHAWRVAA